MNIICVLLNSCLIFLISCTHLSSVNSWPFETVLWPIPQKHLLNVTVTEGNNVSHYQWAVEANLERFTLIVLGSSGRRLGTFSVSDSDRQVNAEWPLNKIELLKMAAAAQQLLLTPGLQDKRLTVKTDQQKRKLFFGPQLIAEIAYTPNPKTFSQAVYQTPAGFHVSVQSNQQM